MSASAEAVRVYMRLQAGRITLPSDPIARLRMRTELELEFLEKAADWARANGITWRAFAEEGVDLDVLRRAGLAAAADVAAHRYDAEIRAVLPARQPFTAEGLVVRSNAPRDAVERLVDHEILCGRIVRIAVSHVEGRSRKAATLYQRVLPAR